ncbi:MAG: PAS domain-containing sensor histidine kinase [Pseudomonadota bacterium]
MSNKKFVILGERCSGTNFLEESQHCKFFENIQKATELGLHNWTPVDYFFTTKTGERFYASVMARPLFSEDNRYIGSLATVTDIGMRVALEKAREDLIKGLEEKNTELERFIYTVSHDLKSPLITIRGFLGLLKEDIHNGQLTNVEKDMHRMAQATDKMHALLTDLLELSRIGRINRPSEKFSLKEAVGEVLQLMGPQLNDRGVQVELPQALPALYGDRSRIQEVFQNLVENAVKFMGPQAIPKIKIVAWEDGSEIHCAVQDNGVGIDPKYQHKIFGLFERLDSSIPGSGVGLAIVKRIVEVHKGRVWVESEGPNHGSTFHFTVPCQ